MPSPLRNRDASMKVIRSTVRRDSTFTGFDAKGTMYVLCPAVHREVWQATKHLAHGWRRCTSSKQCMAFIVALFASKLLTPRFGGFRVPNTTRRCRPYKPRSSSEGTPDDPDGYWDTEITRQPKRAKKDDK